MKKNEEVPWTWAPHRESNFEKFLNFVLPLMHKIVKAVSSVAQRVFPSGVDNKTIIKQ